MKDILTKIVIGALILFFMGMSFYAMQSMTSEEKTNFILMFQQW